MAKRIQLKGMTWDHARGYDPMIASSDTYCGEHPDIRISWEKRPLQAFADRPVEIMAAEYDLMVIDHPHVGEASQKDVLVPLDGKGRDEDLRLLAQQSVGGSHQSYEFDERQWALAIDAATPVAAFRERTLDRAPQNWDEVLQLARSGDACLALAPVNALMTFFGLARNLGFAIADKAEELISHADAKIVLGHLRELTALVDKRCLSLDPIAIYDWMSDDETAPACSIFGYGYTNYSRDDFRRYPLIYADAPGFGSNGPGGTVLGGAGIAVSKFSRHIEAAVDFAYYVAGAECQSTVYFDSGGQPANAVAWEDEACNRASRDFFRNTRRSIESSWIRPRYDGYMEFQARGSDIVHACLSGLSTDGAAAEQINMAYLETRMS